MESMEYFQCSDRLTLSWLSIAPLGLPDVPDWEVERETTNQYII